MFPLNLTVGYADKDKSENKIMCKEKRLQKGQKISWGITGNQRKIRERLETDNRQRR